MTVADTLRAAHPAWAVVPLFYSAMHTMHEIFVLDDLPPDMQCPDIHKSQWRDRQRVRWGTEDVVRARYDRKISTAYSSLSAASRAARYSYLELADADRFWEQYDTISALRSR